MARPRLAKTVSPPGTDAKQSSNSDQLWNRTSAFLNDRHRSASMIHPVGIQVDTQMLERGGRQILRTDNGTGNRSTSTIRAANRLSMTQPATGDNH